MSFVDGHVGLIPIYWNGKQGFDGCSVLYEPPAIMTINGLKNKRGESGKENALLQFLPDTLRVLHLRTASVAHSGGVFIFHPDRQKSGRPLRAARREGQFRLLAGTFAGRIHSLGHFFRHLGFDARRD